MPPLMPTTPMLTWLCVCNALLSLPAARLPQEAPETQPLVLEAIGAWLLGRTSKGASSPADVSAPV